jgi:hypothetical protein
MFGEHTKEEAELIWQAAIAIGHKPVWYTVRDVTTVHVETESGHRHFNPLDPNRLDFFDVLAWILKQRNSWAIQFPQFTNSSYSHEEFRTVFCLCVTQSAVDLFNQINRKENVFHETAGQD